MNNLFQQLNQQNNQNLKLLSPQSKNNFSLFQKFLNSSNPSEFLNSLISQNPQMQNLMQNMQSSGLSPKQFFYNFANQQGVNPDQFINQLTGGK